MNTLCAGIINETEKVFLKKKTIALMIICAIIPIGASIIVSVLQGRLGITAISSTDFPVAVLGYYTSLFLPLFVCMVSVDLFSGELGEKTLKIALLRPMTRFKVFVSKIAAIGIYIAASLGVVFVVAILSGLFLEGKGGFVQGVLRGAEAYFAAFAPMLLIGITAALIAQFFKSSSGALTISIFIYIALKIAGTVFPGISQLLITSYTDWHMLWIASTVSTGKIISVFMFILSYSIIFFTTAFYLFDKKEL